MPYPLKIVYRKTFTEEIMIFSYTDGLPAVFAFHPATQMDEESVQRFIPWDRIEELQIGEWR